MELTELLKNNDLLTLKNKIRQKFWSIDRDDFESAYYVSVWKAQTRFLEKKAKFTTFFYSILFKECQNLVRKERIKTCQLSQHASKLDIFEEKVKELSEKEAKLLTARYLEKKTLREIGDELDLSYETTRKLINNILKKFKDE
jgi:RNA polymerase sigma factor (sigma-70 family)